MDRGSLLFIIFTQYICIGYVNRNSSRGCGYCGERCKTPICGHYTTLHSRLWGDTAKIHFLICGLILEKLPTSYPQKRGFSPFIYILPIQKTTPHIWGVV